MSEQMHKAVSLYPLLEALIKRRSRRFGLGMQMARGPLAFRGQRRRCHSAKTKKRS